MTDKETQFQKIQRISKIQKNIRNIATSAHIHHGKTALTDNLLAASGFMASKNAGDLEEAYKRMIDPKTKMISGKDLREKLHV